MTMRIEKYGTLEEANLKMRGGITGGVPTNRPFENLVGETLTFVTPSGSHTFTQPAGLLPGQLTFADIKSQLEGAISGLEVLSLSNKLAFSASGGVPVSLAAAAEPARPILGLPYNEAISGRVLNPPDGVAPRFVEFVTENLFVYVAVEVV